MGISSSLVETIFVARQPIFDRNMKVWGYEILFRHSETNKAEVTNGNVATSKVILEGLLMAQKGTREGTRFLINFPYDMFVEGFPTLLSPKNTVIEILEDVIIDRRVLRMCIELKKKGYLIALDDYMGEIKDPRLFKIIDFVKIDVLGMDFEVIEDLIKQIKRASCKVIVEKVEDYPTFSFTRDKGGDYFQGFFFQRPQIVKGKTLQPSTLTRLKLMKFFSEKKGYELEEVEKLIKSDMTLSYKLLQYINSPAIGLPHKIKYIRQAINLLGCNNVIKWCRIFLLTLLNPTDKGIEIIRTSTIRAYFFMHLKEFLPHIRATEDELFLMGLFSLLDSLLDQPMKEILREIPLEEEIKKTLLGEETPLSPLLKLICAQEKGDWGETLQWIEQMGLSVQTTAACYRRALEDMEKLFKPA